jgi:hypothetical protein
MKCVSFSIALYEQKWHSIVSLEIGIVIHCPISMASSWIKVWLARRSCIMVVLMVALSTFHICI